MKETIQLFVMAAAVLAGNYTFAQSTGTASKTTASTTDVVYSGRPTLSIGANATKPVGDFDAISDFGFGGDIKLAIPVATSTDITLNAGYLYFSRDNNHAPQLKATELYPFKAGVRYRFKPRGFYVEPQVGWTSANTPGAAENHGGFTYAANLGYYLSNHFDLSARYEEIARNSDAGGNRAFAGLRLAYNFKL